MTDAPRTSTSPDEDARSSQNSETAARSPRQPGKYRVFISYSHSDRALAEQIAAVLRRNRLEPMWDRNFAFGHGFHEQIRLYIAHAHVFLPLLTQESDARKWAHQEIGYAMALHIPVLPIAVGNWPGEMLQQIHAVSLEPDKLGDSQEILTEATITRLLGRHAQEAALYTCADLPDSRAQMMADYAEDVLALGYYGLVRQKGGLSSLHIPTQTIGHGVWKQRYGRLPRSEEHCRLQRRERIALGKHADVAGCRLIINPTLRFERYGPKARLCRLQCLRAFMEQMPDDRCQVAIKCPMPHTESMTLVGDWYAAESRSAEVGKGYFQTTFTRHAPTVIEKVSEFDYEFDELLTCDHAESRKAAIVAIKEEESKTLAEIERSDGGGDANRES